MPYARRRALDKWRPPMEYGMTMVFAVSDPKLLNTVKADDKVKFDAERVNGQPTVTKISPTEFV